MKFYAYCICFLVVMLTFVPCLAYVPPAAPAPSASPEAPAPEALISVYDAQNAQTLTLAFEDYITGIVAAEMPASFEPEALKAQAVAARTYVTSRIAAPAHDDVGAAVCTDSAHCCAYVSEGAYTAGEENYQKVKQAAKDTAGIIMCYEGVPITAAFHSMSAGKTASAADVWGSDVPYLVSVESPLETGEEKFESTVTVSFPEFCQKLAAENPDVSITAFSDIGEPIRSEAGYVKSLVIGGQSFTGSQLRSIFALRSTCFYISGDDTAVTFTVRGYGHGVGMSQYGANNLAKNGADFKTILLTYYTGVELVKTD